VVVLAAVPDRQATSKAARELMDDNTLPRDLGYWERAYRRLFAFTYGQIGEEALTEACETHGLPCPTR
jgi:hypothetical protein